MRIKFLDTGGVLGSPVWNCNCKTCTSTNKKNQRLRPCLLVSIGDKNIIIDFGPDFARQLIENKVNKIDYALLTHVHGDHCNGNVMLSLANDCTLKAPKDVLDRLFSNEVFDKKFLLDRNSSLAITDFMKPLNVEDVVIIPIRLEHKREDENEPCYGYLFKSKYFTFAYCTDYNKILEPDKIEDLDLFISDGNGMEYNVRGHVGVMGSLDMFKKFRPKQMILTHIPHRIEHNKLENFLLSQPYKISVAYDGLEILV